MDISVRKLTDKSLVDLSCSYTVDHEVNVKNMVKMYKSEHSPIRTQMFAIEMKGIPTYVSVHLVRHKFGVEHYVKSNRPDRGGDAKADRDTPVNHLMVVNAQALINMARKRLCGVASIETKIVMQKIWYCINEIDPDLAQCMVADCEYRQGCHEFNSCGYWSSR